MELFDKGHSWFFGLAFWEFYKQTPIFLFFCRTYLFTCWRRWGFVAVQASLWLWWERTLPLPCAGFSLQWFLLLQNKGSRAPAHSLCRGLIALQQVGSSRIRNRTHVSCIGRQLLYVWTIFILVLHSWWGRQWTSGLSVAPFRTHWPSLVCGPGCPSNPPISWYPSYALRSVTRLFSIKPRITAHLAIYSAGTPERW